MAIFGTVANVAARTGPCVLFDNQITAENIFASSTVSGTYAKSILYDDTFSFWSPSGATIGSIGGIFDGPRLVDCAGIAAHNLGSIGAQIGFYYYDASTALWVQFLGGYLPADDSQIFVIFDSGQILDGIRLNLFYPSGGPKPSIGMFRAGKLVEFPTDLADDYTPANFAQTVELYQPASRSGAFFAPYAKRGGGVMRPPLNPMPRDWVNANIDPFRAHYDEGKPFFWAGSPAMMPKDVDLVRRAEGAGELRPRYHGGAQLASITMELDCLGF